MSGGITFTNTINGTGGNVTLTGVTSGGIGDYVTISGTHQMSTNCGVITSSYSAKAPYLAEADKMLIAFAMEEARKKVYTFRRTLGIWLEANRERIERLGAIWAATQVETDKEIRLRSIAGLHCRQLNYHDMSGREMLALFGSNGIPKTTGKITFFSGGEIADGEEFAIGYLSVGSTWTAESLIQTIDKDLAEMEAQLGKITS